MRAILGTNERYFSLVDSVQKYCFFLYATSFLLYDYTTNNKISTIIQKNYKLMFLKI